MLTFSSLTRKMTFRIVDSLLRPRSRLKARKNSKFPLSSTVGRSATKPNIWWNGSDTKSLPSIALGNPPKTFPTPKNLSATSTNVILTNPNPEPFHKHSRLFHHVLRFPVPVRLPFSQILVSAFPSLFSFDFPLFHV